MILDFLIKRWPGILLVIIVLIPNLLTILLPPQNIPKGEVASRSATLILTIFERIGQVGVFSIAMLYTFKINKSSDKLILAFALASLAIYYICWIRFYFNGRDFALLFSPLFFIPIPLAVFPVLCFALMSRLERSLPLLLVTIILAVGHLPISYFEFLKSRH